MQSKVYTSPKPCMTCGGPVTAKFPGRANASLFCSRGCWSRRGPRLSADELPRCEHCGGPIVDYPSHAKRRRFCSQACGTMGRIQTLEKRFWKHVTKGDECWEWNAATIQGYGEIYTTSGRKRANRVAWFLATGEWPPDDLFICHTCDNPPCIRNDDVGVYMLDGIAHPRRGHLWLGTVADNTRDWVLKGRQPNSIFH